MPAWWLLKVTDVEPSMTAEFLDGQKAYAPGSLIVIGVGWPEEKPWWERSDKEKSGISRGRRRHLQSFCEDMQPGDFVVVAQGRHLIHAVCQVKTPEAQFEPQPTDFPDRHWFPHWREAVLVERFTRPLHYPGNLAVETLVKCNDSLREWLESRTKGRAILTPDEEEDLQDCPREHRERTVKQVRRSRELAERCKREHGYTCEICGAPSFVTTQGVPYCEAHHIVSDTRRWDAPENIAVLCATHHKQLHHGADRAKLRERLLRARRGVTRSH